METKELKFYRGDKLKCISNHGLEEYFTVGNVYKAIGDNMFIDDDGERHRITSNFAPGRFIKYSEQNIEVGKWYKFNWDWAGENKIVVSKVKKCNQNNFDTSWRNMTYRENDFYTSGIFRYDEVSNVQQLSIEEVQQYLPEGHPDKIEFEVGKWYEIVYSGNNSKYIVKAPKNNEWTCVNNIEKGRYYPCGCFITSFKKIRSVDVTEIQKYLPDGHPDKIKPVYNQFDVGTYIVQIGEKLKSRYTQTTHKGGIYCITRGEPRLLYINDDNNNAINILTNEDRLNIRWFATKEEAEKFVSKGIYTPEFIYGQYYSSFAEGKLWQIFVVDKVEGNYMFTSAYLNTNVNAFFMESCTNIYDNITYKPASAEEIEWLNACIRAKGYVPRKKPFKLGGYEVKINYYDVKIGCTSFNKDAIIYLLHGFL